MVWCSKALQTLSLQVGQGHDSSIGPKSLACLLSSEERRDKLASTTQPFREMENIYHTQVDGSRMRQCNTESSSTSWEDTVGLGVLISVVVSQG